MTYTTELIEKCELFILDLAAMKEIYNMGAIENNPGVCTCTMNRFFAFVDIDQDKFRCFYLFGSLIDQTMFTHFQEIYAAFRNSLKFPKIYQHGGFMASPSIFCEVQKFKSKKNHDITYEPGPKEVDWDTMKVVISNVYKDCENWFKESKNESSLAAFNNKLIEEINNEENCFREPNKSQLLKLLDKVN